jgi:CO/xanthine dehydrogenase FAD-binding subunit
MPHPRYTAPATLHEAVTILAAEPGARPIAGGTDLLPRLRAGVVAPDLLVDLRRLPLREVTAGPDALRIGACATHALLAASETVRGAFPALAQACRSVGGPPIRNRGTIGGNLANASPAADSAPPLLAYDAQMVIAGIGGERVVPLEGFFLGPGCTALAPGELITEIRLPWPGPRTAAVSLKLGRRRAMAVAVAGVAVRLTLAGAGEVAVARIALGSVAPVPLRATAAEGLLADLPISACCDFSAAAQAAAAACAPISDLRAGAAHRRRMVEVLTRRALAHAAGALAGGAGHAAD